MKKELILIILLLIPLVQSIGASPSSINLNFKPNLKTEIPFNFFPTNENTNTIISISGDLAQYTSLSSEKLEGPGTVTVKISLPQNLESGQHTIRLHGSEEFISAAGVTAGSGVTIPIRIFVPYDGKYIQSSLEILPVNINDEGSIKVHIKNIGTEPIQEIYSKISILSLDKVVKNLESKKLSLALEESKTLDLKFSTNDLEQGLYNVQATIFFDGQEETLEKEFTLGDLIISVINYTKPLTENKINKFLITLESKWNNPIPNAFANISLLQNNVVLVETKSPSISFNPLEIKQTETFLDLTGIKEGEYDIRFILDYSNKQTITKGKIKLVKEEFKVSPAITAGLIILILIILIIWYKKKKNAKKT